MRKGRASGTAKVVAYMRLLADLGLSSVSGFRDPTARAMLDGPFWKRAIAYADKLARNPQDPTRDGLRPYLDMVILRVAFIDALIAERTPKQVVILGAGLDARAYRLEALAGARVIEVDHPDTQAYKRQRVQALGAPLAQLHFAPIDFTRAADGQLAAALANAGFDTQVPTLWIWEGVIMYLDDAALGATLEEIRQLSASGSTLIAHYHEPSTSSVRNLLLGVTTLALGEPQKGLRRRQEMREEIERAGFHVQQDAGLPEQAQRVGVSAPTQRGLEVSRILVANA